MALAPANGALTPLLTPLDVAAWLGVSVRTVARLPLPCVQLGVRKCRRFRRADIEAWLQSHVQHANGKRRTERAHR